MKLVNGAVYENLVSLRKVTLCKTENNMWYLRVSEEDKKCGFIDGQPCTEKEMEKFLKSRFKQVN